ncbi:MAG: outer membrane beta-barrel protein [Xanthobacteraceae bacterium]
MNKLLPGLIAIIALAGAASAHAADMAVKAPPIVASSTPNFNWSGFYVGANAGYGWKDPTVTYTPNDATAFAGTCGGAAGGTCIPPTSFNTHGGLGGLEAGYDWEIGQQWLVGLATDFSWTGLKGNGTSNFILGSATPAASNFQASEQMKWFGTARARLGWLPTNNLLLYGTGGLAYGRYNATAVLNSQFNANLAGGPPFFEYNCVPAAGCFSGSNSRTSAGWTLGAGGELVLTSHITLKAEYLYVNLGRIGVDSVAVATLIVPPAMPSSFTANFSTVSFNIVRAGLAGC